MFWKACFAGLMAQVSVFVFLACVTSKDKESRDYDLTKEEQGKLDEYRAEQEIGRNMAGRLLKFYGNQESEELLAYVNRVGNYVAGFSEDPNRRYMFEILDSEMVNAFACPGGYVLLTVGSIRAARTEAELAMILSHEIAHVGKKHMFNTLKKMSDEELEDTVQKSRVNTLPDSVTNRKRLDSSESKTAAVIARYLGGQSAGLNILKAAQAGMSLILETGLGAEKEYEADKHGVAAAVGAGYDPVALVDYLCRLERSKMGKSTKKRTCRLKNIAGKKRKPKDMLDRTHPSAGDRIKNIKETLMALRAKSIVGARGTKRFASYRQYLPELK